MKEKNLSLPEQLGYDKIRFVVNPTSGKSKRRKRWERSFDRIHRYLEGQGITSDREDTNHAEHLQELLEKAIKDGIGLVVIVGGDGSVNQALVASRKLGVNTPELATVPAGSESIFARASRVSRRPLKGVKQIVHGDRRLVDIGIVRNGDKEYPFGVNAGFGTDAETIKIVEGTGKKGRLVFTQTALKVLKEYKPQRIKVTACDTGGLVIDAKDLAKSRVVIFNNTGNYGGLFNIAKSRVDDRTLEMVGFVQQEHELLKIFGAIVPIAMLRRWIHFLGQVPYLKHMQGTTFTVESDSSVPFHTDGEYQGELPSGSTISTEQIVWRLPKKAKKMFTGSKR